MWIDVRYKHLPRFCFHYDLLTHDTKACNLASGLNVRFGGRNANFGDWLHSDLNLLTPDHMKSVASAFSSMDNGLRSNSASLGSVQREWGANSTFPDGGHKVPICNAGAIDEELNVTVGELIQARRVNARGCHKEKSWLLLEVLKGHIENCRMYPMYEVILLLETSIKAWIQVAFVWLSCGLACLWIMVVDVVVFCLVIW